MEREINTLSPEQRQFNEFKRQIESLELKSIVKIINLILLSDSVELAKFDAEIIIEYNRFIEIFNRCYEYSLAELEFSNYGNSTSKINTWTRYCDLIFNSGFTALETASKMI